MARQRPRTRQGWIELVSEALSAIRFHTEDRDVEGLALACQYMITSQCGISAEAFARVDRLIDRMNKVEHVPATAPEAKKSGRPKSAPQCACGEMSAARALARGHRCSA